MGNALVVHEEVRAALAACRPVVCLESTIITHGMPYPANLGMANDVAAILRAHGVVPATVAVMDGSVCVGLENEQLQRLADPSSGIVTRKTSRRDLAAMLVASSDGTVAGGTTVSATMLAAKAAGVSVFVTGGIGGVHRGAAQTMDISADLTELGQTPVAVVCAGIKSILDIPLTLEYLETLGVPVFTVGSHDAPFPAFFARDSGCASPNTLPCALECARVMHAQFDQLGLQTGLLFANPIPVEFERDDVEVAIQTALAECQVGWCLARTRFGPHLTVFCRQLECIQGRAITPYVLRRVNELSAGGSLKANLALV